MNIAILTNEYPPNVYGGAGVHVEYLSRELASAEGGRHRVQVLCFGGQESEEGALTVRGIQPDFHVPFASSNGKLGDTLLRNILMAGTLPEADVIHCHTWYTHLAGCLLSRITGAPLILTTHSLEPHRPWKREQLGSAYDVSCWLEKTAYENADGVVAVSGSMKRDVHELYGVPWERIRVISNGIDPELYRAAGSSRVLESRGIDAGKPYILFVGRITRQKGIMHLINAVRHLRPGVQIVLCAGAPDTPEIAAEMEERVEAARRETRNEIVWIPEFVPRDELVAIYSSASLFVCPSVYEPFGIINLEAMACGVPVVASAVGGIPEVVVPGETGLLVPFEAAGEGNFEPKNPEKFSMDLATAVNSLLQSPETMESMGKKGRKRVEECFSWRSIANRTLDFYREASRSRSAQAARTGQEKRGGRLQCVGAPACPSTSDGRSLPETEKRNQG